MDSALRLAASEVRNGLEMMLVASMLGERTYDAMEWRRAANDSFELLRNALDEDPFEPNDEMVERVAAAIFQARFPNTPWTADDTDNYWGKQARAALQAAFAARRVQS